MKWLFFSSLIVVLCSFDLFIESWAFTKKISWFSKIICVKNTLSITIYTFSLLNIFHKRTLNSIQTIVFSYKYHTSCLADRWRWFLLFFFVILSSQIRNFFYFSQSIEKFIYPLVLILDIIHREYAEFVRIVLNKRLICVWIFHQSSRIVLPGVSGLWIPFVRRRWSCKLLLIDTASLPESMKKKLLSNIDDETIVLLFSLNRIPMIIEIIVPVRPWPPLTHRKCVSCQKTQEN